jgi:hypothetical protein
MVMVVMFMGTWKQNVGVINVGTRTGGGEEGAAVSAWLTRLNKTNLAMLTKLMYKWLTQSYTLPGGLAAAMGLVKRVKPRQRMIHSHR